MALRNIALLFVGIGLLSTVSSREFSFLETFLSGIGDLLPCSIPCILKRHGEFKAALTNECLPKINRSITAMGNPLNPIQVLNNPAPVCRIYDDVTGCASDLYGRFCGKAMKTTFDVNFRNPLKAYLDCKKTRAGTLLRCMAHPDSGQVHHACKTSVENSFETRMRQISGNYDPASLYRAFFANPKAHLCPIVQSLITCEGSGLHANNAAVCSQSVVDKFKREASKLLDYFVCNTSATMDMLPCLGNPAITEPLVKKCVPKIAGVINPASGDPNLIFERLFDSEGKLRDFLQCVRQTLAAMSSCKSDGWTLTYVDYLINPIIDYTKKAPQIGHCNCEFKDYPLGKCISSGKSVTSWLPTLAALQAVVLLTRSFLM